MKKIAIIVATILSVVALLFSNKLSSTDIPFYTVIPFALMLLSIAVIPLIDVKWWHHNFAWVSLIIGLPMAVGVAFLNWSWLYHTTLEYVSFIVLLGALFTISGGILIKADHKASPWVNAFILAIGAVLANFIGTTGAAMLLIRPLIRINKGRNYYTHVIIFFIFIVANIGGSLTPLGDPPLFLGFLNGVSFFWTLKLFPAWLLTNTILIAIFVAIDFYLIKKDPVKDLPEHRNYVRVFGKRNFALLGGIIVAVLIYSQLPKQMNPLFKDFIQVSIMLVMAYISLKITPNKYYEENEFSWAPIKEVAILFAAIFASMIPALKLLEAEGVALGVHTPVKFFWTTGVLSSFLDNAPTYLSFLSLGKSVTANILINNPNITTVTLIDGNQVSQSILLAISMGAVFMGANTYIGNGPNFMIKSVAQEAGIKMPSYFGYMIWSILILIPVFILNAFIFF